MATLDEFIAEISIENKQLKAGVREGVEAIRSFEKTSQESFEKFAKYAEQNFDKFSKSVNNLSLQNIQDKLDGLATSGQEALNTFVGSASKIEQFRITLETLTGSVEAADKELSKLVKFSAETPFQLEDVVAAGVTLRSFKADIDEFLPLAGDLASVFGRNIKDSARALGKALSGSQDGIQILNDSFGIARRDLKEAGAVMKTTGAISLDTSEDIQALANAIKTVADQKNFTGAIEKQLRSISGNISQLQDASFRLAASVGDSLAPTFVSLVQPATNLVNTLTGFPPVLLGIVGGLTALTTVAAMTTSGMITLGVAVSALKPFFVSAKAEALQAYAAFKLAATGSLEASKGMQAAAVAAKRFGLALGASVFAAGALYIFNQMEQDALDTARAIKEQGNAVQSSFQSFRVFRQALEEATKKSIDFIDAGESTIDVVDNVKNALEEVSSVDLVEGLAKAGISLKSLNDFYEAAESRTKKFATQLKVAKDELQQLQAIQNSASPGSGRLGSVGLDFRIEDLKQTVANLEKILNFNKGSAAVQKETLDRTKETSDVLTRIDKVVKGQLGDLSIKTDTGDLERANELLAQTARSVDFAKESFASIGKEFNSIADIQDALASTDSPEIKASLTDLLNLIKERDKLQKQSNKLQEDADQKKVESILLEAEGIEAAKERLSFLKKAANEENLVQSQRKKLVKEIGQTEREINAESKRAYKEKINQAIFEAQAVEGGAQKKIAALRAVLNAVKQEGEIRRQVLRAIQRAENELAAERKRNREDEAEGYKNEVFRQQELLISQIDERIEKLRQEGEEGQNTSELIVQALKERSDLEIQLIEARTEARGKDVKSAQVQAEIEKTGQLEIEEARRKVEKAIDDQRKAGKARIQDVYDERDAALGAVDDERAARQDLADTNFSNSGQAPFQDDGTGPLVKGAPGQTLAQVAQALERFDPKKSLGPQTGQGAADDSLARRQQFIDLNPGVLEQGESQDAAIRQRIADQEKAQREAIAQKSRDRQDQIANEMRQTREAITASRRIEQAQFEIGQAPADSPELEAAKQKLREAQEAFQQVQIRQSISEPKTVNERLEEAEKTREKKAQKEDALAKSKALDTNINITFEFDDKGQKVIKSVRAEGIDGAQTKVDRTLKGFNLKVNK